MAVQRKTLKDVGIYFIMVFMIIILLSVLNYFLDYILTYEAAVRFNNPIDSFKGYIAFYILTRLILIMPIVWLYVELFSGGPEPQIVAKLFLIVFFGVFLCVVTPSDLSASSATKDIKKLFTYPMAGLLAYLIYTICFDRKQASN